MIERPDVDSLLAGPLGQWLEQQALVRAEAKAKSNRRFLIAAAIGVPAVLLSLAFLEGWVEFVAFAALAAGAAWGYAPRAKAIKETKRGINQAIAEALGLSFADDCEPSHGFALAKTYQMLPSHDRDSFEDMFSVWTDDQVEARYLVHPRYIERLIEVERAFGGQNIRALFKGGELSIVIESGDMFESGSLDASKDRALIQKTCDQFMSLVGLAGALNEPAR